jgi:peptidoglycan hydrolase-like protein with peptidoglycan-binding domain
MGLTDSQVTGSIGPATENALQTQASVTTGSQDSGPVGWVRLFQCAVAFNGYDCKWASDGAYTSDLAYVVKRYQEFSALSANGSGDYETWMSLLVSTGDPNRAGTAFDCMYPLNATTIQTVVQNGYKTVGRYLTGGTNKTLTNSEIALIFANGLSLFPIWQVDGNAVADFSYMQGATDGNNAAEAAMGFGIPYGTVVYFAVDFDATDADITSAIIPYFQGVSDGLSAFGDQYAIGVYGCRNTCIRLENEGLTTRSFVSGMSTGYSGNLGYPLPDNWAFDQIRDYTLASGTAGAVEIDNDIASGMDPGISSVTRPTDPNDAFYTYLAWLEARAIQWFEQSTAINTPTAPVLVAQYLRDRSDEYAFTDADSVFGPADQDFINFVNNYPDMPYAAPLRDPALLWDTDVAHFGASYGAVYTWGTVSDLTTANLADFGSWGGDLVSVLGQFHTSGLSDDQAYAFAAGLIGGKGDDTNFGLGNVLADIDAWVFGSPSLQDPNQLLSVGIKARYASPTTAEQRLQAFYQYRFGGSPQTVADAAVIAMAGSLGNDYATGIRDAFFTKDFGNPITFVGPESMSDASVAAVAEAFRDYIIQLCS